MHGVHRTLAASGEVAHEDVLSRLAATLWSHLGLGDHQPHLHHHELGGQQREMGSTVDAGEQDKPPQRTKELDGDLEEEEEEKELEEGPGGAPGHAAGPDCPACLTADVADVVASTEAADTAASALLTAPAPPDSTKSATGVAASPAPPTGDAQHPSDAPAATDPPSAAAAAAADPSTAPSSAAAASAAPLAPPAAPAAGARLLSPHQPLMACYRPLLFYVLMEALAAWCHVSLTLRLGFRLAHVTRTANYYVKTGAPSRRGRGVCRGAHHLAVRLAPLLSPRGPPASPKWCTMMERLSCRGALPPQRAVLCGVLSCRLRLAYARVRPQAPSARPRSLRWSSCTASAPAWRPTSPSSRAWPRAPAAPSSPCSTSTCPCASPRTCPRPRR